MEKKEKDRLSFGIGLLLGALIGWYLTSDEGRELRQHAGERLQKLSEDLGHTVQQQINQLSSRMDELFEQVNARSEASGPGAETEPGPEPESAPGIIAGARASFLRGMERARRRINTDEQNGEHPED